MYKSVESWKSAMKRYSKNTGIDVQDIQQRFILEEFAKKIKDSTVKDDFILKGGFVVSQLLGYDTRTTRDLDMTYHKCTVYNKENLIQALNEIMNSKTNTLFNYSIESIKESQLNDPYSGYMVTIIAEYNKTKLKMKLDVSNNTLIYPKAISMNFTSMFTNESFALKTYPIENIIAEKYETTLDRGEYNTRMRDLLDIYFIFKENKYLINNAVLAKTIYEVSKDRETLYNLEEYDEIIKELTYSKVFNENFYKYLSKQYPNLDITLNDVFDTFDEIYNIYTRETNKYIEDKVK